MVQQLAAEPAGRGEPREESLVAASSLEFASRAALSNAPPPPLDGPALPPPPAPGRPLWAAPAPATNVPLPGRRRGRRWPRRLLIAANILVALSLVATASAYGYLRWRVSQINGVTLPHLTPPESSPDGGGVPETVLIVGSDTRAKVTSRAEAKAFGSASQVGGQRSDTIMLLRVDPRTNQAMLLSIPRDLWVMIPGTRHRQRINTTFDTGPDLLVRAVQEDLGIPVNHYVEIDFDSFRGMVNAINGIKIYFPTPAKDTYSGLNITKAGCYDLNGDMALAYVRARHYEYFENGFWHFEAESDLARIRRQQDFVKRVVSKVVNSGLTDPARINGVVGAVVNNLSVDNDLKHNDNDLLRLVKVLKHLGGGGLNSATLPTTGTVIGGGDVLLLKQPDADRAIATFEERQPSAAPAPSGGSTAPLPSVPVTPSSIRVLVENGSGVTGQASATSRQLSSVGFSVAGTAAANNYHYARTVIRYGVNDANEAQFLASYIAGGADLEASSSRTGPLVLITGASFSGIQVPAGAPSTASPSTASAPVSSAPAAAASSGPTTTVPALLPGLPANPPPC